MPAKDLFSGSFEAASTAEWVEAIEREIAPGATILSLTQELEPGLKLDPFYRKEDRPLDSGLLPGESGDWQICDRYIGVQPDSLFERIQASVRGGANAVEIGLDSMHQDFRLPQIPGAIALEIMMRGGIHLLDWVTEIDFHNGIREKTAFLVDPFSDKDASATTGFDRLASVYETHDHPAMGMRVGCIDGEKFRTAGAGVVFTIAMQLAVLSEWCHALSERSISADAFVDGMTVIAAIGNSMLLEIAGLRALRLLLPQVSRQYAKDQNTLRTPCIHAVTMIGQKPDPDPSLHLVHATSQAASAVLGGADSIGISPLPAPAIDQAESFRLLRNIQLLLKHEGMFHHVSGALTGAYYVEQLTDVIAEAAWQRFLTIEDSGGYGAQFMSGKLESDLNAEILRSQRAETGSKQ